MIVGLGTDIVDIRRIERAQARHGQRFAVRLGQAAETDGSSAHLAGLFAAKEACVKALGTGFSQGIGFKDITVTRSEGRPEIMLAGAAATQAAKLGVNQIHLSLAHERDYAVATVILEA